MIKSIQKLMYALVIIAMTGMSFTASAQFTNPGFETGNLNGWTTAANASTSTGFNYLNWNVSPANSYMAHIEPASGTSRSSAESFLGLSSGALTTFNSSVFNLSTNFGAIKQSVYLNANQSVTVYWNYVSRDYSPYNDGVFATFVGNSTQDITLLAVTDNAYGSSGTIVTGSYGSTGWFTVTFTASTAGTYTLGLGCFNSRDQAVQPALFVDDAAGGTVAPGQATVTTTPASNVTGTTATTGGNVTNNGGASVTARGVVYGTSPLPTLSNSSTSNGTGTGSFTSNLTGLTGGVTYYVRAYATNSAGTSYGNEVSFTTPSCIAATFTSVPSGASANNTANNCDAAVNYSVSAAGTPAPTLSYSFSGATSGTGTGTGSGSTFNVGNTTVKVTAANACSSVDTTFTVTVTDNQSPNAVCQNYTLNLSNGTGTVSPSDIDNGSSDNCGIASMSVTPNTFTCADAGNNSVTLKVTDVNGNSSTCTANVLVQYQPSCSITTTPSNNVYTGGNPNTIYLGYGPQSATITANATGGSGFIYSWSPSTGLSSTTAQAPVFTPTAAGNYTYTVTVTNSNGCATTCEVSFCVLDIRVPNKNNKVYICHAPPGNNGNAQTLSVSVNAVASHLSGHSGDKLGKCEQSCSSSAKRGKNSNGAVTENNIGNMEAAAAGFKLYPNPNTGTFILEMPSKDAATVMMTNISGQVVYRNETEGAQKMTITVDNVIPGIYMLHITSGDATYHTKVTIH